MRPARGSASVYVLTAAAVVLLAGTAATLIGSAVVARHRAAAAADLGALAAAGSAHLGPAEACATAGRVVRANGARLAGCRVEGPDAVVTAAVRPAGPGARWGEAVVSARAGPVDRPGRESGHRTR